MLTAIAAQRHQLAAGPELRAVAAQVPAFVAGAAVRHGKPHFGPHPTGGAVFRREDPVQRLTAHVLRGPAQDALGAGVPVGHQAVAIGGDDREVQRALEDRPLSLFAPMLAAQREAQVQQRDHLPSQRLQRGDLPLRQRARLMVEHAQRAQRQPGPGHQRDAGVEAQAEQGGVGGVLWRGLSVGNDDGRGSRDHERAEPGIQGRLGRREPDPGLEHLPVVVDERHQGDRRAADLGGEPGDVVESRLGRRIQDRVLLQRGDAPGFGI